MNSVKMLDIVAMSNFRLVWPNRVLACRVVLLLLVGCFGIAEEVAAKPAAVSQQRLTITWREQPLETALDRLAQTSQVAVWLDRRVDPQQRIALELEEASPEEILAEIARSCGLGFTKIDEVVFLGPGQAARDLGVLVRRARDSVGGVPRLSRKRWLMEKGMVLPRLAQPREILSRMLSEEGIRLIGESKIPHDLWAQRELPPLALVDRVVLLLVGFDLTCQISPDGKTCSVVPIPHPVRQRPSEGPGHAPRKQPRRKPASDARKVFSLRLQNRPVGEVMQQLARQLHLEISWEEPAESSKPISRKTSVSCEVHDASLDELLQSILAPAGLRFQRRGQKVLIQQGEKGHRPDS